MNLSIIGHGYVGLVTAAVFADLGNNVWVIGHTKEKIENLKKGKMPFFEPGLEEMVKRNLQAGRMNFTLDFSEPLKKSSIVFICVGTPSAANGEADLSAVFEVAKKIGSHIKKNILVVTKSTVPVGTNKKVEKIIKKVTNNKIQFNVASCPEFLREGSALSDTLRPDRIVIGADSQLAIDKLLDLHKHINGERVITNIETAEMIKYASNAMLSTKISFANAISFISDSVGADVEKVLAGVGLDKRIGRQFLYPGVGFGGSCFPKDVKALIAIAKNHGYDFELLKAVYKVNTEAKNYFVDNIEKIIGNLKGITLSIWGLAFKPDTDDMREAPSVDIIKKLISKGVNINAYDPIAIDNAKKILREINYFDNPLKSAENSDGIVIVTEWNEFKQIDLSKIKKVMRKHFIFDGRNIYDPEKVKSLGFIYKGVGR
jgi:UDPglucose 6-dehydrogenase